MNAEELAQAESSQRQHYEDIRHQELMYSESLESEYKLFSMLKPTLKKDGNKWYCLYGENIQEGISGFGDTPYLAILDWNRQWNLN